MTAKSKYRSAKASAKANPATTTGSVGVVVAIVGRYLSLDEQTQLDIVTLFLIAVPVVRGAVLWWTDRNAEEDEEIPPVENAGDAQDPQEPGDA